MRESKVLEGLSDENFSTIEKMVQKAVDGKESGDWWFVPNSQKRAFMAHMAKEYKKTIRQEFITAFGPIVLIGGVVIGSGYILYKRIKNRKKKDVE